MKTSKSFFLLFLFIPFSLLLGDIINVPADTSTIQGGIFLANEGDTVLVSEGTYFENINFKGKAITVASFYVLDKDTSYISKTIIDGSQPSHPDSGTVVTFDSGEDTTSVLCGFTITGGSGTYILPIDTYGGGGIGVLSGGKIIHNKIKGNHIITVKQAGGGGLAVGSINKSNIIIEYNEFTYNSLITTTEISNGGGMLLRPRWNDGYIRVNDNLISNNSVTCTGTYKALGGGIGVSINLPTSGTIIIENNMISNNELHCKASMGAGIYVVYWEPGGVITDNYPSPIISNNIIYDNYSEDRGAGIGIWTVEKNHQASSIITPQPAIINNTIVNNKANDGSGIFNFDSYPLLMNNILWNDLSVEGSREIFNDDIFYPEYTEANGGELHLYYTDIQGGWEGEGNLDVYPSFVDTSSNNFALLESSRCIGNGIDSLTHQEYWYTCPDKDYYGNKRPNIIDEFIDMGAIESEYIVNDIFIEHKFVIDKYSLSQNYPNPFNPSTTIEFTLPKSEYVELKIYNILGKEVSTLVSNKLNQGNHTYTFDGKNLASGIYYYQIEAGEFHQVNKMILLK